MLKRIADAEKLVADQVERIYMLKSAQANAQKAEAKLEMLCTNLAQQRARFSQIISSVKTYRPPHKLLRETADVGGPRWRIGWGGIV